MLVFSTIIYSKKAQLNKKKGNKTYGCIKCDMQWAEKFNLPFFETLSS